MKSLGIQFRSILSLVQLLRVGVRCRLLVVMGGFFKKNLRLFLALTLLIGIDLYVIHTLSSASANKFEDLKSKSISVEGTLSYQDWVQALGEHRKETYLGTLAEIKRRRFLRVLTLRDHSDYYVFNGYQYGLQYDRVKLFVNHLNRKIGFSGKNRQIKFEMIPVERRHALALLKDGYGDVLASDWSPLPNETKTNFRSTRPISWTNKNLPRVWLVPKGAWNLKRELNAYAPKIRKGSRIGNYLMRKNARIYSRFLKQGSGEQISKYDELFKAYGRIYQWDWRLLAALAFQESRFEQNVVNRWKATGIMQIKPFVAREPYVAVRNIRGPNNAENNIHAGTKYLHWLYTKFFNEESLDEKNRMRLTLAAYNAGPGRIKQARKRATKMGLNPDKWFGHVEVALLKMGYREPVNYVSEINTRFLSYAMYHAEDYSQMSDGSE